MPTSAAPRTKSAKEKLVIPALVEGRLFLCVGPFCWGRGQTAEEAIKNAKSNRTQSYEGPRGWRYVLYDIDPDTYVESAFGGLCYVPKEGVVPYREILRYNMEVK